MAQYAIKCKNLSYAHHKNKYILKNLNLTIQENKIIGIIGNNGSGKTTLLEILGYIKKTKNNVTFYHKNNQIKKKNQIKRAISILHQKNILNGNITTLSMLKIATILDENDNKKTNIKIKKILKNFNIEQKKNQKIKELSGGQQRLVEICKTLSKDAHIYIFDEATKELDETNKKKFWEYIKKIKKQGKTIIITEHDEQIIARNCDIIYKIKNKKIEKIEKTTIITQLEYIKKEKKEKKTISAKNYNETLKKINKIKREKITSITIDKKLQ